MVGVWRITGSSPAPLQLGDSRDCDLKEVTIGDTSGNINPQRLAAITQREFEAGRMDPDDGLHKLAVAGATVGIGVRTTRGKPKRQTYAEAKHLLDEVNKELNDSTLAPHHRKELELHAAALAGVLLSPWFPVSWTRRALMAAIFFFGVWQAVAGNYQPLIWWLLLPFFSPRIMGEAAYFMGRCTRVIRDTLG